MTDTDLKDIRAGEFELVAKIWEKPAPKQEFGQPYQFTRYVEGDVVTVDTDEDARRLYAAGAIVRKGERERQALAAAEAQRAAALAAISPEMREQLGIDESELPKTQESTAPAGDGGTAAEPASTPAVKPPKGT